MGAVKVRHPVQRKSRWYFEPSPSMRRAGYKTRPLGVDLSVAETERINAEWDGVDVIGVTARGTMSWLIDRYRASSWYKRLKLRTLESTDPWLGQIGVAMGRGAVGSIRRGDVRAFYEKIYAKRGLSAANKAHKVLRRLLSYAVELDVIPTNPAMRMGIQHEAPRRQTWTPEEVRAFVAAALDYGRPGWALAARIGYDTAQRLSDILALQWSAWDGEGFEFQQEKTGAEVWCPVTAETIALIREIGKSAVYVVTDEHGRPISGRRRFNRVFRAVREKAGIERDVWFQDLRRTAATEVLAGGGRAEPLTGRRPGSNVLRVYEVPNKTAARAAAMARENARETKKSEPPRPKVGTDGEGSG